MSNITFKGTREGISVTLGEGEWREAMNELELQLARPQAQSFFRGARVLLETGHRAIDVTQIEELIALVSKYDMTLGSVLGDRRSQEAFDQFRAAIPPPAIPPEEITPTSATPPAVGSETPPDGMAALLIQRSVRSGQRYRYVGTIIVVGDVNPGAELIADGDIIVWGKLRGVVHSGANGNDNAFISALVLAPTQLRIGKFIARTPDPVGKRPRHAPPAEIARVRDGNIVYRAVERIGENNARKSGDDYIGQGRRRQNHDDSQHRCSLGAARSTRRLFGRGYWLAKSGHRPGSRESDCI